ncbi:3-deoxy-manno-octulosonate cytidylyltransferase [Aureimonas sp. SK2]|uniref:3-deoxy-manno-octulosonate cytidylyltransferase n=1 Tax=Aureimonas sp. SK2 TaxID=3015992 RepID=UPI0024438BED|nr:3-deoxy-manno-octulosonate cytidylyltransferase [Aureimonas sp. SK2]
MRDGLPQEGEAGAAERWAEVFGAYETVVLVANSDAVRIADLRLRYGEGALFVFFNKVYKVLDAPFDGECLLVARSSRAGVNIVYRREVEDVLRLVRNPRFQGICNLRAGHHERFSAPAEFGGSVPVGHLDMAGGMEGFYPSDQVATSGFALALFLVERCPASRIVLAGFTARRSKRWKLFTDHDWTFEQIVQRLLLRAGRIETAGVASDDLFGTVARRFPDVSRADVALVSAEVLAERLDGANAAIDDLLRATRPQRRLGDWLRSIKPKTRKARIAEQDAAKGGG